MAEETADGKIIRLLIIDDFPDQVEQAIAALRRSGYRLKTHRLDNTAALGATLAGEAWDIVLAEFSAFNAHLATLTQQPGVQAPVIVLAEKIGEDELRRAIYAGARDVVIKGEWIHLILALERELQRTKKRRAYVEAVEALRRMENRYRVMIEGAREAVCYCHDGMHVDANAAYLSLFGYNDLAQLKAIPFLNLIDKTDLARFTSYLRQPEAWIEPQEFCAMQSSGRKLPVEITLSPINIAGEDCLQIGVSDISERKALEEKLQHVRQRDALTGIYNRPYFLQELSKAIEQAKAAGKAGTLMGLELHGLKSINETLGHAGCDQILLLLTRYLREKIGESGLLARVGGGQFAVLLAGKTGQQATEIKEKIEAVVKIIQSNKGRRGLEYDFALNLMAIDGGIDDRHELLRAIYPPRKGNEPAPNRTPTPEPIAAEPRAVTPAKSISPPAPRLIPDASAPDRKNPATEKAENNPLNEAERQAARALEQGDMQLLFQPIINLFGDQHGFYEVLLQVKTQNGGLSSNAELMPMAERMGLCAKLDYWLAQHAIEALAKLAKRADQGANRATEKAAFFIHFSNAAVNDAKLLAGIQRHLKTAGLSPAQLFFQLDASLFLRQNDLVAAFIRQIKNMGAGIVVNNFTYLLAKQVPLANLEIDFIKINCPSAPNWQQDAVEVKALIDTIGLAKTLKKKVVVNGIENSECLALLWNYGIDCVQGGYFHPASPQPDYDFANEHTLDSEQPVSSVWQAAG